MLRSQAPSYDFNTAAIKIVSDSECSPNSNASLAFDDCVTKAFYDVLYEEHASLGWCLLPAWHRKAHQVLGSDMASKIPNCTEKDGDYKSKKES